MSPTEPAPDEFERRLREMLASEAPESTFKEASAAERARAAARRPAPPPAKRKRVGWRDRRRARQLRRPVDGSGNRARPRPGRARVHVARPGAAATPGRQRLARIGKWVAIVAAFCLLLYGLHLLGLGPQ